MQKYAFRLRNGKKYAILNNFYIRASLSYPVMTFLMLSGYNAYNLLVCPLIQLAFFHRPPLSINVELK